MPTVLIAGGSGLIGRRLSAILKEKGYEVLHLSRRRRTDAAYPTYQWDVAAQSIDPEAVERADYVINLAGAGIADRPWTSARKKLIVESRTASARLLLSAFRAQGHWPKAYIGIAAIGYYGSRADEVLEENAPPGSGFLAESCVAWENAIAGLAASGIRTVAIRAGIVLSTRGGALEKIMMPFHFFVGSYFGDGSQWYSWIHIDDLCNMFVKAIEDEQMQGVYNGVAPQPVPNKELVEQLRQAMGKPALLAPVPAFALRLAMGEMAETILSSVRVSSRKIQEAGFAFRFPNLPEALADLLRRKV